MTSSIRHMGANIHLELINNFRLLIIWESENRWCPFFEKNENQISTGPSHFKNLKERAVSMKAAID